MPVSILCELCCFPFFYLSICIGKFCIKKKKKKNYETSNFEFIVANLNGIMLNGINNWNFCIDALNLQSSQSDALLYLHHLTYINKFNCWHSWCFHNSSNIINYYLFILSYDVVLGHHGMKKNSLLIERL